MALPKISFKTKMVTFSDGSEVEVRGLNRMEALHLAELAQEGDLARAEVLTLAAGLQVTESEAEAWAKDTPSEEVQKVTDAVLEVSGLVESAEGKASSTK